MLISFGKQRIITVILSLLGYAFWKPRLPPGFIADLPSLYARWIIWEGVTPPSPLIRYLLTDSRSTAGAIIVNDPMKPVLPIYDAFMQVASFRQPRTMLMLGGGVYTVTRRLLAAQQEATMDAVEIDPALIGIARNHFFLEPKDEARMNCITADARPFLNTNTKIYDLVFLDAYSSTSPPYHLTTLEACRRMRRAVAPTGILVINMISTLQGASTAYGAAQLATLRVVWPVLRCARINLKDEDSNFNQNFVILCAHDEKFINAIFKTYGWTEVEDTVFGSGGFVLYDDYAPVSSLLFLSLSMPKNYCRSNR